ncbi:MAG: electron transport complex subunit RsxE [Nitrospirae bacterium CG08_land_8_20_14_0_20_52_24]|nr:MAG: electron transport complex subunit RsxE [Nitrospirae bacterium CG2_30_53_67]PIS36425.1 MAG: electron transport complex subunit RsxE [Nitrospirae bacterium CG08_land_8_20_14_0_20_52_24]PIV85551.1 MAG: electron transport complex subunit RsxE [Nitrospirae bacterium CG17_big_fil_post_rev_8_21_14_2_50_50_9]PIW84556.1 MAG: electron transport complex subunit RsxE [Nitrospirae bacterium CG_4_8_14_3_um_filter_50_41]
MKLIQEFTKGLWKENPILRLVLGTCPTLATTTSALNGMGMGLATLAVLIGSNMAVALLRNFIPSKVRIPAFIVLIATFVTVVDLLMNAFSHNLHKSLGLFIPLIVVNCIILGRAEAFASRNTVLYSMIDGLGMGLGFTLALTTLGSIREILGNGTLFGMVLFGKGYLPMIVMILPPGAFLMLGFMMAAMNWMEDRLKIR